MFENSNTRLALAFSVLFVVSTIRLASAQTVDLAGLGATTCSRFLSDLAKNHDMEKEYFSWAQGFMSGLLVRAPKGVDEQLKLLPKNFGVQQQSSFLIDYCRKNPEKSYIDGAERLYITLRKFTG